MLKLQRTENMVTKEKALTDWLQKEAVSTNPLSLFCKRNLTTLPWKLSTKVQHKFWQQRPHPGPSMSPSISRIREKQKESRDMAADDPATETHNSIPEVDSQCHHSQGKWGLPFERKWMPSMGKIRRNISALTQQSQPTSLLLEDLLFSSRNYCKDIFFIAYLWWVSCLF